jgi:hypothetical protein
VTDEDELRELQRRAYGRRPDLEPRELARLRTLESGGPLLAEEPDSAPRPQIGRPLALLWAASLVVAVAAGAGAGATLWATTAPDHEVASLPLAPAEDLPRFGGAESTLASAPFHGLRLVKRPSGDDGGACLSVVLAASGESVIVSSGCSARSFPATAQLTVSSSLPAELREQFGEGSGLRFVLEGETVHVRSDR